MQRPMDTGESAQLCPQLATQGVATCRSQGDGEGARALTSQEEEGTPGDGDAALGDGIAVSNSGALHADNTEDHGHEAQEDSDHHQGSCRLDVTWVGRRDQAGGGSPGWEAPEQELQLLLGCHLGRCEWVVKMGGAELPVVTPLCTPPCRFLQVACSDRAV